MNDLLRLSALTATFLVLVATSRAPAPRVCDTSIADPSSYHVGGTCGPEGDLTIDANRACVLAVDGGESLFVPATGGYDDRTPLLSARTVWFRGFISMPNGRPFPRADGGVRAFTLNHSLFRNCFGTSDGGTVISLSCTSNSDEPTETETCTMELTPNP